MTAPDRACLGFRVPSPYDLPAARLIARVVTVPRRERDVPLAMEHSGRFRIVPIEDAFSGETRRICLAIFGGGIRPANPVSELQIPRRSIPRRSRLRPSALTFGDRHSFSNFDETVW